MLEATPVDPIKNRAIGTINLLMDAVIIACLGVTALETTVVAIAVYPSLNPM